MESSALSVRKHYHSGFYEQWVRSWWDLNPRPSGSVTGCLNHSATHLTRAHLLFQGVDSVVLNRTSFAILSIHVTQRIRNLIGARVCTSSLRDFPLVPPQGFEPWTLRLRGGCSNHLSYRGKCRVHHSLLLWTSLPCSTPPSGRRGE